MSNITSNAVNRPTSLGTLKPIALRWLEWQCKMISEVKFGAVFLKGESENTILNKLAIWSNDEFDEMDEALHAIAVDVIEKNDTVSLKTSCQASANKMVCDTISLPLRHDNKIIGAVVFLQSVRSVEQKKAVFQLFQWGCTWLESSLATAVKDTSYFTPLVNSVIKDALIDEPFGVIGYKICNTLAEYFSCKRVILGEVKGLQVHTVALSHQIRFNHRSNQVRDIETTMEESLDQEKMILYPKLDDMASLVTQKHKDLSEQHDDAYVLSVLLFKEEEVIGILLLISPSSQPFTYDDLNALESMSEVLGPIVSMKLKEEHSFMKASFLGIKKRLKSLFGSENIFFKLGLIALLLFMIAISVLKIPHYIYAKSSLEGSVQQAIVSPYDGFIESAEIRAGEIVDNEQVMVRLNKHDLELKQEKLENEVQKIQKEYREALALRERSRVNILATNISQVKARLHLVEAKLMRSTIKAPFSGIVVFGDLSQSLGAPVSKGDVLFKVSPLGDYRVVLNVDDEDISYLNIGDLGSLRLIGLPYDELPITISRIIPVSSVKDGSNYFRVEASLDDMKDTKLKPGMQGITQVAVGEESIFWVWSHTLVERIRLWFWSIGL